MQQIHPSQLAAAVNVPGVVLVDFFTPTCQPCQRIPPMLQEVERATGAPTYKVDMTQDMDQAVLLGIRTVPTVLVYKNGVEVNRAVGVPASAQHFVSLVRGASG